MTPSSEHTGDPELAAQIAEHAKTGNHHIAAFTIADGETTFAGLGADEHEEFEIGSVTKTFTAGILAERGLEDTTVGEIIDASGSKLADVSLRELADHTSGLPRLGNPGLLTQFTSAVTGSNPYAGPTREDVITDSLEASLEGRGEHAYSNLGVGLLEELLAIEAGTTYEEFLDTHVLSPLGMADTYVMTDGSVPPDAPRGLLPDDGHAQPWEMGGYNGAGAIRTTAADMVLYASDLLEKGVPDLTWVAEDDGSYVHGGATFGFSTMLVIHPKNRQAVFVVGDSQQEVETITAHLVEELA
ncbi:serine hydrolase [Corynebacterium yudongzhengii]|uniref:Serine hydrolase n=1 Tax=Corynebacterium yudongzhengii TaxID=2080740 RepID=A0A2U1T9B6_9CORY|nr:serine hydrolase [Corynebacterium yudongzhengii]PWC02583.1 serine hydrolase [Corynebacterium yudongzhengii]